MAGSGPQVVLKVLQPGFGAKVQGFCWLLSCCGFQVILIRESSVLGEVHSFERMCTVFVFTGRPQLAEFVLLAGLRVLRVRSIRDESV